MLFIFLFIYLFILQLALQTGNVKFERHEHLPSSEIRCSEVAHSKSLGSCGTKSQNISALLNQFYATDKKNLPRTSSNCDESPLSS